MRFITQALPAFRMGALLGLCAILASCAAGLGSGPAIQPPETIVATVNGEPIRQGDVDGVVANWVRETREANPPASDDQVKRLLPRMIRDAREFLIDKTLVAQAIKKDGIRADEALVDQRYREMEADLKNNGLTIEGLQASMQAKPENIREKLREGVQEKMYWDKHLGLQPPSEAQLRDYYQKNARFFSTPPAVHLREVYVAFPEGRAPSRDERTKLRIVADSMRARLLAREPLAAVARDAAGARAAADPNSAAAQNAGDLGWVTPRAPLPPEVLRAAFSQPVNQVGPVIESSDGYHILVVGERRESQLVPFEKVRDNVAEAVLAPELRKRIPAEVERLRRAAKIERK